MGPIYEYPGSATPWNGDMAPLLPNINALISLRDIARTNAHKEKPIELLNSPVFGPYNHGISLNLHTLETSSPPQHMGGSESADPKSLILGGYPNLGPSRLVPKAIAQSCDHFRNTSDLGMIQLRTYPYSF